MNAEAEAPFDAPWQARAFALAEAAIAAGTIDREDFRLRLIAAIADDAGSPYWESWLSALEASVGSAPPGA